VRLAALNALERSPKLLAEALRRRAASEPPEVREALEELRWRQPS
jgi:hypothetical protein